MTVGESLKRFRRELGLNQKEVASRLGILAQAYSRYENGQHLPKADVLITLAKEYGVTTDYLLGLTNTPRPAPDNATLLEALLGCRDLIQSALDTKVKGQ